MKAPGLALLVLAALADAVAHPRAGPDPAAPAVIAVTSSTVTLAWPRAAAPSGATITFGAEPPVASGAPLPDAR
ncbi:MAG TPA: hypothetical protein VHJ20_11465, partial [Polyangia bacterium]|nr:hypothetical protein [Polyangia bacterium]